MTDLQKQSDLKVVAIGNDADFINSQIDLGNQSFGKSLEHYRNAGERLAKVRSDLRGKKLKGIGFQAWIEQNCKFERTKAYRYISIWENWNQIVALMQQSGDIYSLTDALKALKDIKSKSLETQDEVEANILTEAQEQIETKEKALEAIKQEAQNKLTEAEKIALEIAEKEKNIKETASKNSRNVAINKQSEKERDQLAQQLKELQDKYATLSTQKIRIIEKIVEKPVQVPDFVALQKLEQENLDLKMYAEQLAKRLSSQPKKSRAEEQLKESEKQHHILDPDSSRNRFIQCARAFKNAFLDRPDLFTEPETSYVQQTIAFMETLIGKEV